MKDNSLNRRNIKDNSTDTRIEREDSANRKKVRPNPLYSKAMVLQYLLWGMFAAVMYFIFLMLHLMNGTYESSYLLYIGNAVFGTIILIYNLTLIGRPYVRSRTVSMMMAAHCATVAGTVITVLMCVIAALIMYPDIFSPAHSDVVLENSPANTQGDRSVGWLFMIVIQALILNFSFGSFVSIVTSYAGKKNQTKDNPAHLGKKTSNGPVTNDPV